MIESEKGSRLRAAPFFRASAIVGDGMIAVSYGLHNGLQKRARKTFRGFVRIRSTPAPNCLPRLHSTSVLALPFGWFLSCLFNDIENASTISDAQLSIDVTYVVLSGSLCDGELFA